jgi:hypothetical protein
MTAAAIVIKIPAVSAELPAARAPPPNIRATSVLITSKATRMM